MNDDRTETLEVKVSRAMSRRLKKGCARTRLSVDDIFELGFNAVFPPEPARRMPRIIKRPAK